MSTKGPDALTELIGALREQLAHKQEREAWLEGRLKEAIAGGEELARRLEILSQQVAGLAETVSRQHDLLQALAARSTSSPEPVQSLSDETSPAGSSDQVGAPPTGPLVQESPEAQSPAGASAVESAAPPPDLSESIQVIASTVVQAAQRKVTEEAHTAEDSQDEREITARFSRKELQKGHRGQGAKRGIWPFRQRSDPSA